MGPITISITRYLLLQACRKLIPQRDYQTRIESIHQYYADFYLYQCWFDCQIFQILHCQGIYQITELKRLCLLFWNSLQNNVLRWWCCFTTWSMQVYRIMWIRGNLHWWNHLQLEKVNIRKCTYWWDLWWFRWNDR